MKPQELKDAIDRAVAKYGPDFEIWPHGPGHEGAFKSGFGAEVNWYMAEVIPAGSDKKHRIMFLHGCPVTTPTEQFFPVKTGDFPLFSKKIEGGDF